MMSVNEKTKDKCENSLPNAFGRDLGVFVLFLCYRKKKHPDKPSRQLEGGLLPFAFCLFTIYVLTLSGCDDTFQPIQENPEHPFTIYGHLDASVDTNWVRVTPVRETLYLEEGDTTDAVVTIEHLETGEIVTLKDSLFQRAPRIFVLNWWTTMQLEPMQSYRLVAKKPDGRASSATVTLPDTFPEPIATAGFVNIDVYIEGVKNLADASVYYLVRDHVNNSSINFKFTHLKDTVRTAMPPGVHQFNFNPEEHESYIDDFFYEIPYTILGRWIYVASAGPEWIYFPDYDERELELPDAVTNIENGAGFLIGVVSKRVEF